MVIVWIIVAIFAIGVFVGIVSLLSAGVRGDARDRRTRFRRRHRRAGGGTRV
jgi:hypothetical protein